ncbi:MAG TPA: hypothetical protein VIJ49_05945 [Aestuariivirga sp.]
MRLRFYLCFAFFFTLFTIPLYADDIAIKAVDACLAADDLNQAETVSKLCSALGNDASLRAEDRLNVFIKLGDAAYWNSDFVEAGLNYDKGLAIDPKNVTLMISKGRVLRRDGKYEEAFKLTSDAVALDPQNPLALCDLAQIYPANDLPDKLPLFKKATELKPDYVLPRISLAQVYINVGQYVNAISELDQLKSFGKDRINAEKLFPSPDFDSRDTYLIFLSLKLEALMGSEEYDQAAELVKVLRDEYPKEYKPKFEEAMILAFEKKFDDALAVMHAANAECDQNPKITYCWPGWDSEASILVILKRDAEAMPVMEKMIDRAGNIEEKARGLEQLGFLLKTLGQPDKAIVALREAMTSSFDVRRQILMKLKMHGHYMHEDFDSWNPEIEAGLEECIADTRCN